MSWIRHGNVDFVGWDGWMGWLDGMVGWLDGIQGYTPHFQKCIGFYIELWMLNQK